MEYLSVNLSAYDNSACYIGDNRDVSYKVNPWDKWVNYGPGNDLPYFLAELASGGGSPTHFANLRLKKTLTAGGGFLFDSKNIALKQFIEDNNLNKVLEEIAWERVIFNSSSLQVGYTGKKITNVWSLTIPSLRVPNVDESKIEYYYVSKDWRRVHEFQYQTIPSYYSDSTAQVKIMYDYTKTPNNFYYPVEDYRNGINAISTESNLTTHWLSVTQNSMTPSGILSINDDLTPEQMQKLNSDLKRQHTGSDNSGKIMLMVYGIGKEKPEFVPMQASNIADIYNTIDEKITQKICTIHGLNSPQLAGLPGGGSIFTDSLSSSFEYFQRMIIKDYQKPILAMFAKVFMDAGLISDASEIAIKALSPTQFIFDPETMRASLTRDEIRELAGYAPAERESQNLAEQIGVGGLTGLIGILSAPISNEQKMGTLVQVFGIEESKARDIVFGLGQTEAPITPEPVQQSLLSKLNPFKFKN